jgi:hypothetical protein
MRDPITTELPYLDTQYTVRPHLSTEGPTHDSVVGYGRTDAAGNTGLINTDIWKMGQPLDLKWVAQQNIPDDPSNPKNLFLYFDQVPAEDVPVANPKPFPVNKGDSGGPAFITSSPSDPGVVGHVAGVLSGVFIGTDNDVFYTSAAQVYPTKRGAVWARLNDPPVAAWIADRIQTCEAGHQLCQPDCEYRTCGPDGCGGSCGTCTGTGERCVDNGSESFCSSHGNIQ